MPKKPVHDPVWRITRIKGTMLGRVVIPLRMPDGKLVGYLDKLPSLFRCPKCGNRVITVAFEVPNQPKAEAAG
jgi:hypothetical protein